MTADLADFLLARIADDEQAARECAKVYLPPWDMYDRGSNAYVMADAPFRHVVDLDQGQVKRGTVEWLGDALDHVARWDPARVLAECEAKRAIVELHQGVGYPNPGDEPVDLACTDGGKLHYPDECPTLRLLALPYADHPDFDESWRP